MSNNKEAALLAPVEMIKNREAASLALVDEMLKSRTFLSKPRNLALTVSHAQAVLLNDPVETTRSSIRKADARNHPFVWVMMRLSGFASARCIPMVELMVGDGGRRLYDWRAYIDKPTGVKHARSGRTALVSLAKIIRDARDEGRIHPGLFPIPSTMPLVETVLPSVNDTPSPGKIAYWLRGLDNCIREEVAEATRELTQQLADEVAKNAELTEKIAIQRLMILRLEGEEKTVAELTEEIDRLRIEINWRTRNFEEVENQRDALLLERLNAPPKGLFEQFGGFGA